jgi:transposase
MDGKSTTTRGRPAKPLPTPSLIIKAVLQFLQIFMPETLAKRIVGVVLIAIGIPNELINELTGMSDRSIWRVKETLTTGNIDDVFVLWRGGGRPGNAKGFESEIVKELEKNNYQTRQQIADMIYEKFGIAMSVSAVGKLLKKTALGD